MLECISKRIYPVYSQLYNEDINDLLAPGNCKLPVHESKESGIYVAGLREDIVSTPEQVLELLEKGELHRHVGETKMNKNSSRSHTIFRMVIESRSSCGGGGGGSGGGAADGDVGAIRVSALTLVDLAGSERIAKTGAEGQRAKEGAAINKSLLTLGTVINKLSEGVAAAGGHIPYRDSKLTRILQPSLGGNAKTAIICAITPAAQHVEESHSSLRFACRAKRVVNNATVNEVLSDAAVLKRQAKEIEDLRNALQGSGNVSHIDDEINILRAELLRKDQEKEHMSSALAAEKDERERAQRKVDNMTRLMLEGGGGSGRGGGSPVDGVDNTSPTAAALAVDGDGAMKMMKKKKRENRRETWCPGAAQRKRPLLPSTTTLPSSSTAAENHSLNHKSGGQPATTTVATRRSDGGALLSWSAGSSPPRKVHCTESISSERASLPIGSGDGGGRRSSAAVSVGDGGGGAAAVDVDDLHSRIRELETSNELMQRELDAVTEAAQRTQQQLRDAEDELMAVADERDKMGPALKEAQWKARQLEKEVAEVAAERDAAVAATSELEAALATAQALDATGDQEVKHQLEVAAAEVARLREELDAVEKVKVELAEVQVDKERVAAKLEKAKLVAAEAEDKAKALGEEVVEVRAAKQAMEERFAEVEVRSRSLYEETQRLSAHISDLESRKRAPLYQKRQEDELRAAIEKAAEAEIRASDAELKVKEAKTVADAAEQQVANLQEELQRAQTTAAEEAADVRAQEEVVAQRAAAEAELVAVKHAEALTAAQGREESLVTAKAAVEASLNAREADVEQLQGELEVQREAHAALVAQQEETQACADAAAQHVLFLEEKAETEAAEAEKEKKTFEDQLEGVRGEMASAEEAHSTALAAAAEEREALSAVNAALEEAKAELEAKVAIAAGAINAAEELKELRRKYKDETARLNQALKSASVGSKGTERAADKAVKETERMRTQIKDLEGKVRSAVADKNTAQMEKAALDRELGAARAQVDKLSKNMSKIAGVEERKRESVMQGFTQAKSRMNQLEDSLAATQNDLERTAFELENKRAEAETLLAQLEEVQRAGENAAGRVEELEVQLEGVEADGDALRAELDAVRADLTEKSEEASAAAEKIMELEGQLEDVQDAKAMLIHEKAGVETELEALRAEAVVAADRLAAAEAQLPRIQELQSEVEGLHADLETVQKDAADHDERNKVSS